VVLGQAAESNSIFGCHRKAPKNIIIFDGFFHYRKYHIIFTGSPWPLKIRLRSMVFFSRQKSPTAKNA
jgi:hypothetical protein